MVVGHPPRSANWLRKTNLLPPVLPRSILDLLHSTFQGFLLSCSLQDAGDFGNMAATGKWYADSSCPKVAWKLSLSLSLSSYRFLPFWPVCQVIIALKHPVAQNTLTKQWLYFAWKALKPKNISQSTLSNPSTVVWHLSMFTTHPSQSMTPRWWVFWHPAEHGQQRVITPKHTPGFSDNRAIPKMTSFNWSYTWKIHT